MSTTSQGQPQADVREAELESHRKGRTAQWEQATKDLEAFAYSMSHDLRAPLRGIVGLVRGLLEDHGNRLDDDGRRTLGLIGGEARRMSQLIADLVAYSRAGSQPMEVGPVDMTDLARSAFQNLVEPMTTPGPALRMSPLSPAHADRVMLREVFNHLLGNAIKFTRGIPGGVVEVMGTADAAENTYCVADNGVGFDQRYAHKLFGVFQRLHREQDFAGSGVGLAVVQRLIQRHGGRTWASGEVNRGARFHFALPNLQPIQP
jgi:light-regulated signal transduction histidine kinase (bacteriophytochrome)